MFFSLHFMFFSLHLNKLYYIFYEKTNQFLDRDSRTGLAGEHSTGNTISKRLYCLERSLQRAHKTAQETNGFLCYKRARLLKHFSIRNGIICVLRNDEKKGSINPYGYRVSSRQPLPTKCYTGVTF